MLLELLVSAWMSIAPNGSRTVWDVQPTAQQVTPGSTIYLFDPQPGEPKDPNLYSPGMGGKVYPAKAVTSSIAPQDQDALDAQTALDLAASNSGIADEDYIKLFRICQIKDHVQLSVQWQIVKQNYPLK